jgi:hypothetical protein
MAIGSDRKDLDRTSLRERLAHCITNRAPPNFRILLRCAAGAKIFGAATPTRQRKWCASARISDEHLDGSASEIDCKESAPLSAQRLRRSGSLPRAME